MSVDVHSDLAQNAVPVGLDLQRGDAAGLSILGMLTTELASDDLSARVIAMMDTCSDVNQLGSHLAPILHTAAKIGLIQAVDHLLSKGVDADIQSRGSQHHETGLFWATRWNQYKTMLSLMCAGANRDRVIVAVECFEKDRMVKQVRPAIMDLLKDPLYHVAKYGLVSDALRLVAAGFDPSAKMLGHLSPLKMAAKSGKEDMVSALQSAVAAKAARQALALDTIDKSSSTLPTPIHKGPR